MELTSASNIAIGLVVILFFGYALVGSLLLRAKSQLEESWDFLLLSVRKRSDMIPLILEKMRAAEVKLDLKQLLDSRWQAERNSILSAEKNKLEQNISALIKSLLITVDKHPVLKKDAVLASQIKALGDFQKNMEKEVNIFNDKVKKFNRLTSFFLFIPLLLIIKVKPLPFASF